MVTHSTPALALIDGEPAPIDLLADVAFASFAHFTAMQVRGGLVRGLDLHLARLREASASLFAVRLDEADARAAIAHGAERAPDCSLTATVFVRRDGARAGDLGILVRTAPPVTGPEGPLRLATYEHERFMPAIKHVGEPAKHVLARAAMARGFDDAVFVDRDGVVSEASIWNLAFWDGQNVVWPSAPQLAGTTATIVRRGLERLGAAQRDDVVRCDDLAELRGAVVMNSWTPAVPVSAIDDVPMHLDDGLESLLHRAFETESVERP